ncbi:hypothetical protein [Bosea sp. (in: a-proteobacteria)]|uniref:hypothetical protein n=1 Tax=Bosea sp. (in: a-proteobacteria) TaxID=1871050 RepID=UPI0026051B70|nr:hypothetical protein [Bosea sp. (in: a-proteobacteria)]MCO5092632.1 hypothetical protein [Bosea sp. (in: a-proteobacteria)]
MNHAEIKKLFDGFGADIDRDDVWQVQSATVIKHKALERLAAAAKIEFEHPQVLRAERDEAVILVVGKLGERCEWSIGEALVNTNYRVTGKMAAYVYAMAEKRAKDRVILKLAGLHGLYSEDEADEFKESSSAPQQGRNAPAAVSRTSGAGAPLSKAYGAFIRTMNLSRSKAELREWFFANKDAIAENLSPEESKQLVDERNKLAMRLPEFFEGAA